MKSETTIRETLMALTTGPVNAYPEVLQALSRPVLYDYDPNFRVFYTSLLRKAAKALDMIDGLPVILQGEPVLALEAVAASALRTDDVMLNLVNGPYSDGFGIWARRYCRAVLELRADFDMIISPDDVRKKLKENPEISVVSVCHHDTPSGTLNPIDEIGKIVHAHGAALIVDTVSSFGGVAVSPGSCCADFFITGPNKCLGCPPGLSLVAISAAGWARMHANPQAPRGSVLSLLDWENVSDPEESFPYTPSVSDLFGMDAALDRYLHEGPERVWARHAATAAAFRAGLAAMGLELWARDPAFAAPTATACKLPPGVDDKVLLARMQQDYGVMLSVGRGATAGKVVRVGHMGPTAYPIYAVPALAALGSALRALGHDVMLGEGLAAAALCMK